MGKWKKERTLLRDVSKMCVCVCVWKKKWIESVAGRTKYDQCDEKEDRIG